MKHALLAFAFLALALSTIACASTSRTSEYNSANQPPVPAQAMPPPAATAAPAAKRSSTTSGQSADEANTVPSAATADRMIVYTVNLRLDVADADKTANDITAIAAQFKGYVAATNFMRDGNGKMRGTITLRIPAESLDPAQKQIEATAIKVLNRAKDSNDVTDQYTDLNARLKNLTATEDELRKMMDSIREKSNKAEDILAVYRQLTEIRTQIEQIKGQMNVLEKTSAFATMTVELVPHEEINLIEPEAWIPNRTAAQAVRTLIQTLQGLADLIIWLVLYVVPILVILLLPFVALALVLRAWMQRRNAKKKTPTSA